MNTKAMRSKAMRSKTKTRGLLSKTAALLALTLLMMGTGECGEPILKDTGFDIWCGDKLCAWTVESGDIKRVPTWHRSDFGVELVGDFVALSQVATKKASCLEVALQANADEGVSLTLELDFFDDGKVDYVQPLLSDNWQTARHNITPPTYYEGLRVRVVKRGAGRAVIARIRIATGTDCKDPPIDTTERPLGTVCEKSMQCASGYCANALQYGALSTKTCGRCEGDQDCQPGERCGLEASPYRWLRACVKEGSRAFGSRCIADPECETGVCCEGSCSACCPADGDHPAPCAGSGKCAAAVINSIFGNHPAPALCDPGLGAGAPGDNCLGDSDCASARCHGQGELKQCLLEGLPCSADSECALGECISLGKAQGECG